MVEYNFPKESDYEEIEIMACTNHSGNHYCNVSPIDCYREKRMIRVLKEKR